MKALRTFKQQGMNPKADVAIHKGAIVTVDGEPTRTAREDALAMIILRLNATSNQLRKDLQLERERDIVDSNN